MSRLVIALFLMLINVTVFAQNLNFPESPDDYTPSISDNIRILCGSVYLSDSERKRCLESQYKCLEYVVSKVGLLDINKPELTEYEKKVDHCINVYSFNESTGITDWVKAKECLLTIK